MLLLPPIGHKFTWKHGRLYERLDWCIVNSYWKDLFPMCKDEIYWKQRYRVAWLKSGDKNTKYFHHKATTRNRNNLTRSITLEDGSVVNRLVDIEAQFVSFYSSLFTSQGRDNDAINIVLSGIYNTLAPDQVLLLDKPYSEDEIKNALFSILGEKAPGSDGFNAFFYQKNWSTLRTEFTSAILAILNHDSNISLIIDSVIVLIPKKKNACKVRDFRPISLCTTMYKVVAKVLANRIKPVLDSLISKNQSALLSDCLIFDNIFLDNEVVNAITNRKRGRIGWATLKLDMEKAFDRVEWSFVDAILKCVGFPNCFVNLILRCISSVTFRLLINGKLSESFPFFRGIRKGDPLSPYLFLMIAERLSAAIRVYEEQRTFTGFAICRNAPIVSNLLFADDSLLFTTVNDTSCRAIQDILSIHNHATGQILYPFLTQYQPYGKNKVLQ
uniref:Reverse transcriptase domain-containing protein n=1 Tax=Cannabis sativa TaxID=3483 RepID=A0A803QDC3_CANSA